jgi:maltokinase
MHAELLKFADESAPRPDGSTLRSSAEATLDDALRVTAGPAGTRLGNREATLRRAIASIPDSSPGPAFDIHGDWHVGQVLRAPTDDGVRYWAIDFDGDPQLTPEERDQPDYAARDVAHLLCSVELVGAVVMRRLGAVNAAALDWAATARTELLASYRDQLKASGGIHAFDERLLDGFVVEQLLRELIYADRFLPRWQYAPDAVLTFRYQRDPMGASSTEEPWTPPVFMTT